MKLDPDEKKLLKSFERGEWKPTADGELARLRELAQQGIRRNAVVGPDTLVSGRRNHRPRASMKP